MKVLAVDDHAVVRQGLAALLVSSGAVEAVEEAASLAEALALAASRRDLDAVILDLKLPDAAGAAAVTAFARAAPTLPIIVVSASEDPADVRRALDAGALGYAPKSASPETLVAAVRTVLAGGVYTPPLMQGPAAKAEAATRAAVEALTPRQQEVLAAVGGGLSNKEIGRRFDLSEKTVKAHMGAILTRLGVANRTQAARVAIAVGLTPPARPGGAAGS
jgi:DNA-binding NarL/FixJ family response regulator